MRTSRLETPSIGLRILRRRRTTTHSDGSTAGQHLSDPDASPRGHVEEPGCLSQTPATTVTTCPQSSADISVGDAGPLRTGRTEWARASSSYARGKQPRCSSWGSNEANSCWRRLARNRSMLRKGKHQSPPTRVGLPPSPCAATWHPDTHQARAPVAPGQSALCSHSAPASLRAKVEPRGLDCPARTSRDGHFRPSHETGVVAAAFVHAAVVQVGWASAPVESSVASLTGGARRFLPVRPAHFVLLSQRPWRLRQVVGCVTSKQDDCTSCPAKRCHRGCCHSLQAST